jgi:hypothetical protein
VIFLWVLLTLPRPSAPRITSVAVDGQNAFCEVIDAQTCPQIIHCDCGVVVPVNQ